MSKWQYESDITPSTITITDLVNQDWVMRITPDRRIEVNEDVEVTEAARKVLDVLQALMDRQRQDPPYFEVLVEGTNYVMRFIGKENYEGVMMYTTTIKELQDTIHWATGGYEYDD